MGEGASEEGRQLNSSVPHYLMMGRPSAFSSFSLDRATILQTAASASASGDRLDYPIPGVNQALVTPDSNSHCVATD